MRTVINKWQTEGRSATEIMQLMQDKMRADLSTLSPEQQLSYSRAVEYMSHSEAMEEARQNEPHLVPTYELEK